MSAGREHRRNVGVDETSRTSPQATEAFVAAADLPGTHPAPNQTPRYRRLAPRDLPTAQRAAPPELIDDRRPARGRLGFLAPRSRASDTPPRAEDPGSSPSVANRPRRGLRSSPPIWRALQAVPCAIWLASNRDSAALLRERVATAGRCSAADCPRSGDEPEATGALSLQLPIGVGARRRA